MSEGSRWNWRACSWSPCGERRALALPPRDCPPFALSSRPSPRPAPKSTRSTWHRSLRIELISLVPKEHIECGHGTVAACDVLLHLHLFCVGQFLVTVNLLFEDTQ